MSQSFPPPPPLQPQQYQPQPPQPPYPQQQPYPQQPAYQPVPPPMPAQTLGYASPHMMPTGYGVWRQGDRIVAMREIDLGDVCVKCGAPSEGFRWKKTLYWHEPWVYALILPGVLIYAICAMVLRKGAKVSAGLCPVHRKRRNMGILLTWLLSLGGIGGFIGGCIIASERSTEGIGLAMVLVGFILIIAAAIVGNTMTRVLTPKKIDEHYAWFGGASEAFLQTLPNTP